MGSLCRGLREAGGAIMQPDVHAITPSRNTVGLCQPAMHLVNYKKLTQLLQGLTPLADYATAQKAAQEIKWSWQERQGPFSVLFLTTQLDYLTATIRCILPHPVTASHAARP